MRAASPRRPVRGTPDDVAELLAIAELLAHMPREWVETREDVFNALRRLSGRLRTVAGRLERELRPRAKPPAIPAREKRELDERRRRARVLLQLPAGQGHLPL